MKNSLKTTFHFILIALLLPFFTNKIFPNSVSTWFRHYGGTQVDGGHSIQQSSDGGYIVAGWTYSFSYGDLDFGIYKLDSSGNKVWFKHYGGTNEDIAYSIQQTSDGGYIVAGDTSSFTYGNKDVAIYKLDSNGNKQWFKHYGGINDDGAQYIQQTSDDGYIVAGNTASYTYGDYDFAVYKLDSSGNKVWFKHYGGTDGDFGRSIQQTTDGSYIVAGEIYSDTFGGADFGIYKLDSSGNQVWFKHYGGTQNDLAYSIQQTTDGGYIVTGVTKSYTYGNSDFAIYKLDSNGNKQWFRHYGGTQNDLAYSIQQTSDGGYILAGVTESYTYGNKDFAIYRLNSSGNKAWFRHYGGPGIDHGWFIQQTTDGGYIVAGETRSYANGFADFGIYKLDSNGNK